MKIEPFQLERWMTTYELEVDFDIAESGIAPLSINELLSFLPPSEQGPMRDRLLDLRLGYAEARGSLALRELLAATYAATTADQVLVTTGAIEANFLLFNVLLEPGDAVVVIDPAYQQLQSVPRAIGCDVALWRPHSSPTGFWFDVDELESLVSPRTRLIVINTPHNPTGAVLSQADLERIYAIADQRDAYVLSDEAYRWLPLPGGAEPTAPMRDLGPRGISVGTLSKPFGLPGLRLGWLVAPDDVVRTAWAMRDYVTLSPGGLSDLLAQIALRCRGELAARTEGIVTANLDTAESWFARNRDLVQWTPPAGGLLSLLKYHLDLPSNRLANRLAEEYGVMLAPGAVFGHEGYLRLGIGARPSVFASGLGQAERCFRDLLQEGVALRSDTE